MHAFVEALVTLLPHEMGGRSGVVAPRDGSYCPWARLHAGADPFRVRMIEGPPLLAPGETARAVLEIDADANVRGGTEAELLEWDEQIVGVMTVLRLWPAAA